MTLKRESPGRASTISPVGTPPSPARSRSRKTSRMRRRSALARAFHTASRSSSLSGREERALAVVADAMAIERKP